MGTVDTREQQSEHHSRTCFFLPLPDHIEWQGLLWLQRLNRTNFHQTWVGAWFKDSFPIFTATPPLSQKNVKNRRFTDSSLYLVLKATVALHQWHEKPFHRLTRINVVRLMLRFLARMWWERNLTPMRSFTHLFFSFDLLPHLHILPTLPFPILGGMLPVIRCRADFVLLKNCRE